MTRELRQQPYSRVPHVHINGEMFGSATCILSDQLKIVAPNTAFLKLSGFKAEELAGKPIVQLFEKLETAKPPANIDDLVHVRRLVVAAAAAACCSCCHCGCC